MVIALTQEMTILRQSRTTALEALDANVQQQRQLHGYIEDLKATLEDLDMLIEDTEKYADDAEEDGVEDGNRPPLTEMDGVQPFTIGINEIHKNLLATKKPKRKPQAHDPLKPKPWLVKEKKNLREAVIIEQKRQYAFQLRSGGNNDVLATVASRTDEQYAILDATELDFERIAIKLASLMPHASHARSAAECKLQWIDSDHPRLKHGPWTSSELTSLSRAVKVALNSLSNEDFRVDIEEERELPNISWTEIAEVIGGERTIVDCKEQWLRFHGNIPEEGDEDQGAGAGPSSIEGDQSSSKGGRKVGGGGKSLWAPAEDELLIDAVSTYGVSAWPLVAASLPFVRTPRQCSDRYRQSLDPNIRRAKWTAEEDNLLTQAVQTFGGSQWARVRDFVPKRTSAQCRERWCNVLDPTLKKSSWTEEEDQRLCDMRNAGSDWPAIATALTRTDNQCWRRYKLLQKRNKMMAREASERDDDKQRTGKPKRRPSKKGSEGVKDQSDEEPSNVEKSESLSKPRPRPKRRVQAVARPSRGSEVQSSPADDAEMTDIIEETRPKRRKGRYREDLPTMSTPLRVPPASPEFEAVPVQRQRDSDGDESSSLSSAPPSP